MKTIKYLSIIILLAGILISGCSKLKKELPAPTSPTVLHSSGWADTSKANFHGFFLKAKSWKRNDCIQCHGKNSEGGVSNISCFSCHSLYPHKDGWVDANSVSFHGQILKDSSFQLSTCRTCHGSDLNGGISGINCTSCHSLYPHISGWADETNPQYHGAFIKSIGWNPTVCKSCHGTNLDGGTSGVSCYSCHDTYPHSIGWVDVANPKFHGTYLEAKGFDKSSCKACHGVNLDGGTSGISCTQCHDTYPHASDWLNEASQQFHGNVLKSNSWDMTACKDCHGGDLKGGISKISCYNCHESYPHVTGWVDEQNTDFHGRYLAGLNWDLTSCKACHGTNLDGGTSGVSCTSCHESFPHTTGWTESASPGFHGKFLKTNNWDLASCTACHGSNYDGGDILNVSCMTSQCHVDLNSVKKSPEACNTCHGTFNAVASAINSWAPPKSVDGETATTVMGVGAHQKHLATGTIGKSVKCQECHSVPSQAFASGHLDTSIPAEVVFNDTLAKLITGNGTLVPNPSLNVSNSRCDNVYCHGNWKLRRDTAPNSFIFSDSIMVGANYSPLWTGGTAEAACGSCHGLPPTGHQPLPLSACGSSTSNCHTGIVNSSGVIIDQVKHINGKINLRDSVTPMN